MKYEKSQNQLGVHDVRLSGLSQREGRMERKLSSETAEALTFFVQQKRILKIRPLTLCYLMKGGRQKSVYTVRKVTGSLFC
jgi:hypothetical protein